jgi:hypothetical protein
MDTTQLHHCPKTYVQVFETGDNVVSAVIGSHLMDVQFFEVVNTESPSIFVAESTKTPVWPHSIRGSHMTVSRMPRGKTYRYANETLTADESRARGAHHVTSSDGFDGISYRGHRR